VPDKTKIHTVYKLKDGGRVPSVTTILGVLNKPALIDWAWKLGTQGIDYKAVRDQAGDIGTLSHYLILCELQGIVPDTSDYSAQDINKAETCLLKYYEWSKAHEVKPLMTEAPLVSENYHYGGTIDFYGVVDNQLTLLDFKTGKAIYQEHFFQVAGYRQLLEENNKRVDAVRILRIGRDETEGFEDKGISNPVVCLEVFLDCLDIYRKQGDLRRDT